MIKAIPQLQTCEKRLMQPHDIKTQSLFVVYASVLMIMDSIHWSHVGRYDTNFSVIPASVVLLIY
jgi:hypothetical protein